MNDRHFKWCVSLFLLCLPVICAHPRCISYSFAQPDKSPSDSPSEVPSMVLGETMFDFGEVDEGSVVSHDFIVKNNGRVDLRIEKVRPD
ncbi:MAG: hypothetical protein AAGU11_12570 [Syntrophobacteraceae bacterium]